MHDARPTIPPATWLRTIRSLPIIIATSPPALRNRPVYTLAGHTSRTRLFLPYISVNDWKSEFDVVIFVVREQFGRYALEIKSKGSLPYSTWQWTAKKVIDGVEQEVTFDYGESDWIDNQSFDDVLNAAQP